MSQLSKNSELVTVPDTLRYETASGIGPLAGKGGC